MPYSEKFKLRMIQRLTAPGAPSALQLSREVGVSQPTLSLWLRRARRLVPMTKEPQEEPRSSDSKSPRSWSAKERYRIVVEAAGVSDADLGEFLRKRGLHAAHLEEWRRLAAEGAQAALAPGKKRRPEQSKASAGRVRQLERELDRKNKALAELAALVALKKKLDLLWGDEDEPTPRRTER